MFKSILFGELHSIQGFTQHSIVPYCLLMRHQDAMLNVWLVLLYDKVGLIIVWTEHGFNDITKLYKVYLRKTRQNNQLAMSRVIKLPGTIYNNNQQHLILAYS